MSIIGKIKDSIKGLMKGPISETYHEEEDMKKIAEASASIVYHRMFNEFRSDVPPTPEKIGEFVKKLEKVPDPLAVVISIHHDLLKNLAKKLVVDEEVALPELLRSIAKL